MRNLAKNDQIWANLKSWAKLKSIASPKTPNLLRL